MNGGHVFYFSIAQEWPASVYTSLILVDLRIRDLRIQSRNQGTRLGLKGHCVLAELLHDINSTNAKFAIARLEVLYVASFHASIYLWQICTVEP